MYKFRGGWLVGMVFLISLLGGLARGAVIYRETFGIATGSVPGDQFATVFDWQRFDASGQPITTTGTSSGVNYNMPGRPIDVSNVNAGPNNDGTFGPYSSGILYLAPASPNMAFTTEFVVDPAKYVPGSIVFSWYEGNNTAVHFFRLLVRVGGVWYASTNTFSSPAVALANFGTQAVLETIAYDPTASKWQQVNFDGDFVVGATPGTGVSTGSTLEGGVFLVGPAAADLSGPITAFGVYGENGGTGTGNRRIDSFTVEATPLVVSSNKTVIWTAVNSGDWDVTSANWRTNSPDGRAVYVDGDFVRFDDSTPTNEVNIVPQVLPGSLTVSNVTRLYRFSGGGSISGTTGLRKQGAAILMLANANNSFTGGILIEGGTLQVGDGGANGSLGGGNVTNNATLIFNRTGSIVVTNAISGSGTLHKAGAGALTLTASNSYAGLTAVEGGTFVLNGILGGAGGVTGDVGTTITGSGTNMGQMYSDGEIRPGDGIGTLTTGALWIGPNATNYFELGTTNTIGAGVNDLIQVNGNLQLTNSRVVVVLTDLPRVGVPYRLISYTGTRSGIFNGNVIVTGVNRYTAELSYDDVGKTVNLTFIPPANPSVVIYRETFGIAPVEVGGADQFATVFDWARFDNFGQPILTGGNASGVNFSADGRPTNVFNVNAGPNNDGSFEAYRNGILYLPAATANLALTTEFQVNPTNYVPGSIIFSWYEGNNTAGHLLRLLVRVGGKWYASVETFTSPAVALTSFGTQAQLKTVLYDPAAANWQEVNFDGDFTLGEAPGLGFATGSSLADVFLGSAPAADLAGTITAFGLYGENSAGASGNRRIDTFTIEAAPVSSSAKPRIAMVVAGDQLTLNVTGGLAGWNARVMSSSDVGLPLSAWIGIKSGTFDGSGNFSATVTIDPAKGQQFFAIQAP
jgi:autotransporter-associated beta strand protein